MAVIKCKMCGGDLNLTEGSTVAECEYCGSKQTVPTADSEKKMNLFARANRLRANNEFDKAAGVYESIVADFPEEAEAYWGLILCRYGIEYVDDPATGKKIPTCHRSSFDSVMDDQNFELVMEYADPIARRVYREEAKQIEELRKGIIEVSSHEEPYDIFICYKETDENGQRTLDSVLAQDVYDMLTENGYRVFFSRVSLEDKLGVEYEPYIFAALNSAKIMLAFGTDYDYYNAVWVKNEWSRFLQLIARGEKKTLIPCYKSIDAYDMPKEFAKLQAQDLGKVGANQDLLRGIRKILPKDAAAPDQMETQTAALQSVQGSGGSGVVQLLKRAFMFLEDGDWQQASEYCQKALDLDPENAEAFLGLLLSDLRLPNEEALKTYRFQSSSSDALKTLIVIKLIKDKSAAHKVLRDAGFELREAAIAIASLRQNPITVRVTDAQMLQLKESGAVFDVLSPGDQGHPDYDSIRATTAYRRFRQFASLERYKQIESYIVEAEEKHRERLEAERKLKQEQAERARIDRNNQVYDQATERMRTAEKIKEYQAAVEQFRSIPGWKDADALASQCSQAIQDLKTDFQEKRKRAAEFMQMLSYSPEHPVFAGLAANGSVFISNEDEYIYPITQWKDVVKISLGEVHALGLTATGKVRATGSNQYGQCDVSSLYWKDVVDIRAGGWHSIGLRADGTVVAAGSNTWGQCNVSSWRNITAIAVAKCHTVGLQADGTVVATGLRDHGRCDVEGWRDVVKIYAFNGQTVGLKKDGTLLIVGPTLSENITKWTDIVDIAIGYETMIGLKEDGTVSLAVRNAKNAYVSQDELRNWNNIVAVSVLNCHVVGLKADGTVVAAGLNKSGQCNVDAWKEIVAVCAGLFCTLGVKRDGTVISAGEDNKQPHTRLWRWKLFQNSDTYLKERNEMIKMRQEEEQAEQQRLQKMAERRKRSVCQYCGGEFKKKMFTFKCVDCGRSKDY